jgi:hypothetical protein
VKLATTEEKERRMKKPLKRGAGTAVPCPYKFKSLFVGGGYLACGGFGFAA